MQFLRHHKATVQGGDVKGDVWIFLALHFKHILRGYDAHAAAAGSHDFFNAVSFWLEGGFPLLGVGVDGKMVD